MYTQLSLFSEFEERHKPSFRCLNMPDADVVLYEKVFTDSETDTIFKELYSTVDWEQKNIVIYGKQYPLPRLTAWYGDKDKLYIYSKIKLYPKP